MYVALVLKETIKAIDGIYHIFQGYYVSFI